MGNRQSCLKLTGSAVAILGIGSLDVDWQHDAISGSFTSICRTRAHVRGLMVEVEVEGKTLSFRVDTESLSVFTSTASGKAYTSWSPYSHEEPLWERPVPFPAAATEDKGGNPAIREELKLRGQSSITSSTDWIALCEEVEIKFDVSLEVATYRGMRLRRESWFSPRQVACCYAKVEVTSRLAAELRWRRNRPLEAAPPAAYVPSSPLHPASPAKLLRPAKLPESQVTKGPEQLSSFAKVMHLHQEQEQGQQQQHQQQREQPCQVGQLLQLEEQLSDDLACCLADDKQPQQQQQQQGKQPQQHSITATHIVTSGGWLPGCGKDKRQQRAAVAGYGKQPPPTQQPQAKQQQHLPPLQQYPSSDKIAMIDQRIAADGTQKLRLQWLHAEGNKDSQQQQQEQQRQQQQQHAAAQKVLAAALPTSLALSPGRPRRYLLSFALSS